MSVVATIALGVTARETITGNAVVDAQQPTVVHNKFNVNKTLNAATVPPVTQVSSQTLTGTQTIDLTALPTIPGNVNATGLKVRAFVITNKAGNTGALAVGGAANPYLLLGAITLSIPVGGTVAVDCADGLVVVAAGNKNLLFTPNNPADSYNVEIVVG